MTADIQNLRKEMVRVSRLMHERGLVAGLDGNVSAKIEKERYLITPSGVSKGFIKEGDLLVMDGSGKVLEGEGKASSEFRLHLGIYRLRPEVRAVCHGHPVFSVAASITGIDLSLPYLPEVVLTLKGIPTATYATPGTDEVPKSLEGLIENYDAVILARHGVVAVGNSPLDAYLRLEKAEHTAKTLFLASLIKRLEPLGDEEVKKLLGLRG